MAVKCECCNGSKDVKESIFSGDVPYTLCADCRAIVFARKGGVRDGSGFVFVKVR